MDPLAQKWSVSAWWVFRDTEYVVSADVQNDVLVVQVEEKLTADQWRGQFEAKHIEELTHKTGNFKQFPVFLNMLESAITKSTGSVSLDLLTYSDLEALRNRKLGGKIHSPTKVGKQLHAKRYLILTYSVEFDRYREEISHSHNSLEIHYPLALPYAGKPDPAVLQDTVKRLHSELEKCKKQAQQGHRHSAVVRLQREYDALLQEKEELEEAFESFRQEVTHTREGNTSKETRLLKKIIKNLEEDILKERSKHQRYVNKRNEEIRTLLQEPGIPCQPGVRKSSFVSLQEETGKKLEELRSSERTLRTRVKSLTNELAVMKRGLRNSPSTFRRSSSTTKKSTTHLRHHSSSADRHDVATGALRSRIRTPSPSGARIPRFNPTGYVQNRKRKQQEADIRLGRLKVLSASKRTRSRSNSAERPPRPSPSLQRSAGRPHVPRPRPRTSSVGSNSSRASSRASSRRSSADLSGSGSSVILITAGHKGSGSKKSSRSKKKSSVHTWSSPAVNASTPADPKRTNRKISGHNDSSLLDHSAEISEIDARLNALQQFMKRSLETTKHHPNT